MVDDRTERLKEAQGLGLQSYYDSAFKILDDLLAKTSNDVAALRLKGNLLELKAFEIMEHNRKKLTSSADYLAARDCYEKILEIDPRNARAYIDLGDHYKNLDANDRGLEYYGEAVKLLKQAPKDDDWNEDVEELCAAVAPLTKHERLATEASRLEAWCKRALGASDKSKYPAGPKG